MVYDPLNDGISEVKLIDSMGDDLRVVNAARVSFNKESHELSEQDKRLINYLARHNHWTPFSHVMVTLRIKMPIFVARQWYKHMIGFTRNEVSRRYVDDAPEFFIPTEWRLRAENKKQGSSDEVSKYSSELRESVDVLTHELVAELYRELVEEYNVAPEQARIVLPQNTYTEFYETGSLAGYARLCGLRDKPDAQLEIQQYAKAVDSVMRSVAPVSWDALCGD